MNPVPGRDFLHALHEGWQAAQALLDFLQRENEALVKDALDDFLELSNKKKEKIATLEAFDRTRAALLKAAGLSDDEAGMQAFLGRCCNPQTSEVSQQWEKFLEVLKACQQQNETNGCMIHARQRQIQEALAILRGQLGTAEVAYDQQGRTTTASASTPIAKV